MLSPCLIMERTEQPHYSELHLPRDQSQGPQLRPLLAFAWISYDFASSFYSVYVCLTLLSVRLFICLSISKDEYLNGDHKGI